jgi:hypothetical protein
VFVAVVKGRCESESSTTVALWSFVCDRDPVTIDPLVKGQQLIAPEGAGFAGKAIVSASFNGIACRKFGARFEALCRALQQA